MYRDGSGLVLQSMRMGIEIASALAKLYPGKFDVAKMIELVGNAETIKRLARRRRSPQRLLSAGTQTSRNVSQDAGKISFVSVKSVSRESAGE